MKSFMFVAALMMGTAAVAQTPPPAPADSSMTPAPADSAPAAPAAPDASMAPPPAAPPAAAPMAASAAPAPQASYPKCSASVTDGCRQGSGRESNKAGGKPAHRHHRHK